MIISGENCVTYSLADRDTILSLFPSLCILPARLRWLAFKGHDLIAIPSRSWLSGQMVKLFSVTDVYLGYHLLNFLSILYIALLFGVKNHKCPRVVRFLQHSLQTRTFAKLGRLLIKKNQMNFPHLILNSW